MTFNSEHMSTHVQSFSQASLDFQERIHVRNGLSHGTYCPPSLHAEPPLCSMDSAREEARMVLFGAVAEVLERTGALCCAPCWSFWLQLSAQVLQIMLRCFAVPGSGVGHHSTVQLVVCL